MGFSANKTPSEIIKEGAYKKWYKKLWKEFDHLKNID